MNIRDAAKHSGLPVKTVRYYDEIGLVTVARAGNGYRDYDEKDIHKLRFLGRARKFGFSIEDCRLLLSLYEDKNRASLDVKRLAEAKILEIEARISELDQMRSTLENLAESCHGDDRPDCPILDNLGKAPGK